MFIADLCSKNTICNFSRDLKEKNYYRITEESENAKMETEEHLSVRWVSSYKYVGRKQ